MQLWVVWRYAREDETNKQAHVQGIFSSRDEAIEAIKERGDELYFLADDPVNVNEMMPDEPMAIEYFWPIQDVTTDMDGKEI